MGIDRCVCHDMSFAKLKAIAEAERLDFRGLSERTGCGDNCGLCGPYVREMLRTGVTEFPKPLPSGCAGPGCGGTVSPRPRIA